MEVKMGKRNSVATMTATVEIDKRESFEQLVDCIKDMQSTADKNAVVYTLEADKTSLKKTLNEIRNSDFTIEADIILKSNAKTIQQEIDKLFASQLDISNLVTMDPSTLSKVLSHLYDQVGDANTQSGKDAAKKFATAYNVAIQRGIKFQLSSADKAANNQPFAELMKYLRDEKIVISDFEKSINKEISETIAAQGEMAQSSRDTSSTMSKQYDKASDSVKQLKEDIKEFLRLQEIISQGNKWITHNYSGVNQGISSMVQLDSKNVRNGSTTKSALKRQLDSYLEYKKKLENASSDDEKARYQKMAKNQMDSLAAYVYSFHNAEEAVKVFGKKNKEVFDEVQQCINKAIQAHKAYEEQQLKLQSIKGFLYNNGLDSMTGGQSNQLVKALNSGGFDAFSAKVKELFGIEIPQAIERATVSEEENVDTLKKDEQQTQQTAEAKKKLATAEEKAAESMREALEVSRKQDAGSSVELLSREYERLEEEAREAANSIKELWLRAEGGTNNSNFIRQALNDYTTETITSHTDSKGNEYTTSNWNIQYDKMKTDILKKDKEILELEYKIHNAQGDTSGSQKNLEILKQERLAMFDILDAAIRDPNLNVNQSQKEALNLQRRINEEKIRNSLQDKTALEISRSQVAAERENAALADKTAKNKQKQIQAQYAAMRKQSSEAQAAREKEEQQKVNSLLNEQAQAYKKVWDLRKEISKLNPNENANEIKILEEEKKKQLEIYNDRTRTLKKINEQANAEAQINNLLKIRKAGIAEINRINSSQTDKTANTQQKKVEQEGTSQNKKVLKEYNKLISELEQYYELRKKILSNSDDIIPAETNAFNRLSQDIAQAVAGQGKFEAATQGTTESLNRLKTAQLSLSQYFSETSNKSLEVSQNLNKMQSNLEELASSGKYTSKLNSDLKELADDIKRINNNPIDLNSDKTIKEIARIEAAEKELINRTKAADEKLASSDSIAKLNLRIEEFIQKNSKMGNEFRKRFENLKIKWDSEESVKGVRELSTQFRKLETEVYAADKIGKSFFATLSGRIKQMSTNFIAMYFSLYDIIRYVRTSVNTIRELDNSLVDLRKTTTMTNDELNDFYNNSSSVAKQLGATTQEIIQQAANWSRLGYSSKEAATEMAALSSQFAAISPGMDLDTATDDLVSTMQAFHIEVNDTERDIMDNVNRIGKYMPKRMVTYGVVYAA